MNRGLLGKEEDEECKIKRRRRRRKKKKNANKVNGIKKSLGVRESRKK